MAESKHEDRVLKPELAPDEDWNCGRSGFFYVTAIVQIALCILFYFWLDYSDGTTGLNSSVYNESEASQELDAAGRANINHYYPLYQDVHVMIFIGFGFLMTFLQKYGFSAVGYNMVIAALCIQWAMLLNGWFHKSYENYVHPEVDHFSKKIEVGIINLITSDFAAGAVLITFGAVLGKTSPTQMIFIALFELIFYGINELIGAQYLQAVDMGGSMFVHTFGAYFGLALSKTLSGGPKNDDSRPLNSSTKTSDMFAMIGTLFLWMFWPSFNGALATQDQQVRVVVNTVLALTASCFAAFLWDATVRSGHKFDMETIQNATLAGGVAVGSSSDLVIQPYAAIIIGFVAGTVSVLGYVYVSPILQKHLGIDDTCGVHNLHGMPGIIGGIGGVLSALVASTNTYGNSIGTVFAARAACEEQPYGSVITPCGRTALEQANNQAYALIATVCISVFGGIITGLIVKIPYLNPGNGTHCQPFGKNGDERRWYNDKHYWEVPEEEHEHHD